MGSVSDGKIGFSFHMYIDISSVLMVTLDFRSICTLTMGLVSDGKTGFPFHLYIDNGFSF